MLSLRTLFTAATAVCAAGMVDAGEPVPQDVMALDDECDADATCALNALQVRAATQATGGDPDVDMEELEVELPEGWHSDVDFPEDFNASDVIKEEEGDDAAAAAPEADDAAAADDAEPAGDSDTAEEEEDSTAAEDAAESSNGTTTTTEVATTTTTTKTTTTTGYFDSACEHDQHNHGCFLYRHCVKAASGKADNKYCVMSGYTIVPAFPITGTESINKRNAEHVDPIMDAAYTHCSSNKCVLMVNPKGHRTQEQLYIHYRHYNKGGGSRLKTQLETTACYQSGWHKVHGIPELHKCKTAQVRSYSQHPTDIFSQVAEAQGKHGKHSLDGVGVTVYPKACPRSKRTIVLFTEHCTIEKSISKSG